MAPINPQFIDQLLGTVLSTEGGPPLAQTPQQSQAEPIPDLDQIIMGLQSQAAKPLNKKQKVVGGLADVISGFLATKYGRPRGPSAIEGARDFNQQEADRTNQDRLRKAQVELGERSRVLKDESEEERFQRGLEADRENADVKFDRELQLIKRTEDEGERNRLFRSKQMGLDRDLRASLAVEGADKDALKRLDNVNLKVLEQKGNLTELLKTKSPRELREDFNDFLHLSRLGDEAEKSARLFFEVKVGRILDIAEAKMRSDQERANADVQQSIQQQFLQGGGMTPEMIDIFGGGNKHEGNPILNKNPKLFGQF